MVEIDEIATIFKRKIYPNGDIEFIPFKIIEGYYDDDENWFLDASGNTYHHISEFITSGNVYGERRKISFLVTNTKNKKLTFSDMKKNILKISKHLHTIVVMKIHILLPAMINMPKKNIFLKTLIQLI